MALWVFKDRVEIAFCIDARVARGVGLEQQAFWQVAHLVFWEVNHVILQQQVLRSRRSWQWQNGRPQPCRHRRCDGITHRPCCRRSAQEPLSRCWVQKLRSGRWRLRRRWTRRRLRKGRYSRWRWQFTCLLHEKKMGDVVSSSLVVKLSQKLIWSIERSVLTAIDR